MVMPRSRSSGALSMVSKARKATLGLCFDSTLVIAAVSVVLPWSMCPMVPMFTCGLVRSNLAFATGFSSYGLPTEVGLGSLRVPLLLTYGLLLLASGFRDDLLGNARRDFGVRVELHGVVRPALGPAAQVPDVAEHLRQRHECLDDPDPGLLLHRLDLAPAAVQVADDVTHVLIGGPDLNGHHRLQQ